MTVTHDSNLEQLRLRNIVDLVPKGRSSLLDVGARDCWVSAALVPHFQTIVAVDLECPPVNIPGITAMRGDATRLDFPDRAFDTVVCAEVLEHIPQRLLRYACRELCRVAKYDVVIGTPYRQDTRVGRATCQNCRSINPPWGHVNVFDEDVLGSLFAPLKVTSSTVFGKTKDRTNWMASKLMDMAGNPWGAYTGPCLTCNEPLLPPIERPVWRRACGTLGHLLTTGQQCLIKPKPIWVYMVFRKDTFDRDLR